MLAKLNQRLKGWKTLIFGHLVAVFGTTLLILEQLQPVDLHPVLPAKYADAIIAGIGVVIVLLRVVTTGPVGRKDR